jgi:hypothetical protein
MGRHRQADVVRSKVVSCLVGRGAVSAPPPYRVGWNGLLSDQDASARTWHRDRLYRRGGVPSIHIAKSDECLMMRQYRTWTLLALLALAPAKGQTPDTTPRVRGFFSYGLETCKKRCADDAACFKECTQHELTPDELRDIVNQQKQQPRK